MKIKLLLLTFICFACTTNNVTGPEENGELSRSLSTVEKQLVEADNSFSFKIFKQLNDEDDNIFVSPLSVSLALGMTLNGAEGDTYKEIRETLALKELELEEINEGYKSLIELLVNADPKVKIAIANSVWNREGFPVEDEFTSSLKEYFDAETRALDFKDPKSVDIINKWVKNNTNGLIEKIIEGRISDEVVMYLINAIYFKGDWASKFDKEETNSESFHLESGEKAQIDMMSQKYDFNIHFSEEVKMIDLPYGDSLFSMTVMMPTNEETPLDVFVEEQLNQENFDQWISQLSTTETLLKLPKFEMEYEKTLNDILKSMGMTKSFSPAADFSGINPKAPLQISEVKHKTFVKVDEEGTEAAAVTSVAVGITSVPSYQTMVVDRPFVFVIREQNTGTILFMGKVKDPS